MKRNKDKKVSCSITEVKQSPMAIFNLSEKQKNGVYIYNRNDEVGVMLSIEQYERLTQTESHKKNIQQRLAELEHKIRKSVGFGSIISAKNLNEKMTNLGFMTRNNESNNFSNMFEELNETGKIDYQLQKKEDRTNIFAEVIGEQSNYSNLPNKIIVKKIHLKSDS